MKLKFMKKLLLLLLCVPMIFSCGNNKENKEKEEKEYEEVMEYLTELSCLTQSTWAYPMPNSPNPKIKYKFDVEKDTPFGPIQEFTFSYKTSDSTSCSGWGTWSKVGDWNGSNDKVIRIVHLSSDVSCASIIDEVAELTFIDCNLLKIRDKELIRE